MEWLYKLCNVLLAFIIEQLRNKFVAAKNSYSRLELTGKLKQIVPGAMMEKISHYGEDMEVIRFVWEMHFSKKIETEILISNLVWSFLFVWPTSRWDAASSLIDLWGKDEAVTDILRKVRS